MNKKLSMTAFGLGLMAVIWVAMGYAGSHFLALTMTLIIGAVYILGALELHRFHRDTGMLDASLRSLPLGQISLDGRLAGLPAGLRNAVRLRIEGERIGLPGPAVTPYLVGLLVMLGMLGTFLGMVVTLNGAVMALEGSSDLATIRTALSAPVKGLGLAFGTSVAGVAASAMLGLVAALCRRERQEVGLLLDTQIAGALREFSLTQQRQETFKAMQQQAQALPAVVDKLQALMDALEQQNRATQQQLTTGQQDFHRQTQATYTTLATSVEHALRTALADSARTAVETVTPAVDAALDGFARQASTLQERTATLVERQLDGFAARFDSSMTQITAQWASALDAHHAAQTALDTERLAAWSQAPQAATDLILHLRTEISAHLARDNALLVERQRIGTELQTLITRLEASATAQEAGATQISAGAVEVASLGEAFAHAVEQFGQTGESLTSNLQRIEAALEKAMGRSDDQLAYYVAQAREIIDLSVMSQQRVVEDLRQIAGRNTSRTTTGVC